jgi:uncharacterized damage-inducible protein DinB
MMLNRDAIEELYGYTEFTWSVYGMQVELLPPGELAVPVPGSGWPALIDAFRHLLFAYDRWLHERLGAEAVIVPQIRDVASWEAFEDRRTNVRASFRRVLDETPDVELFKPRITVGDPPGMMSAGDVLAHVLLHERGHHGDISTLFFAKGIEMPSMDYRVYLYSKRGAQP